ncbi:MAG TPA: hypothetical protein VJK07_02565 [Candidatus Nanoarchaeia archaeon]|nr:hypothetical protein [Candidatus Nanoarchaeia archaeon]
MSKSNFGIKREFDVFAFGIVRLNLLVLEEAEPHVMSLLWKGLP